MRVAFFSSESPLTSTGGQTKYVQVIKGRMLDTVSSNAQPPSPAVSHGNESYNLRASPFTLVRNYSLYGDPLFEGGVYFY